MMLSTQKKHLYWQRIRFVSSVLLFSIFVFQILANIAGAAALVKPINNLGLVGYWSFEDGSGATVTDFSGNENHGTATGGVSASIAHVDDNSLSGNNVSSRTYAIDATGADFIVVGVEAHDGSATDRAVSSVTFNGDALTKLRHDDYAGGVIRSEIWYLANPDQTSGNVVVSMGGACVYISTGAVTLSGVDTSTPVDVAGGAGDNGFVEDPVSTGITTVTDGAWLFDVMGGVAGSFNSGVSAGAGQTGVHFTNHSGVRAGMSSFKEVATAGATTMSWDNLSNTNVDGAHSIMAIRPEVVIGSTPSSTKGRFGSALLYDGVETYVDVGNIGTINTISFWINTATTTSQSIIDINGTDKIEIDGSGNIVATSFPNATVYVDGSSSSAALTTGWHHVVITDPTGVNASTFEIGRADPNYFGGIIDEVRVYNRELSASEVGKLTNTATVLLGRSSRVESITGLLGWWTFDGRHLSSTTATDASGNGNDGTLSGGPVPTIGRIGQGLEFDGADDKIQTSGNVNIPNVLSVAAWIYPRTAGEGSSTLQGTIFSSVDTSDNFPNIQLRTRNSSGAGNLLSLLVVFDNGGISIGQWDTNLDSVELNEWQHVAMTYDTTSATNDPLIYINGSEVSINEEDAPVGSWPSGSAPWVFGNTSNQGTTFDGYIDDIRVYSRALSNEEITRLYNATRPSTINPN